ncbi:MAG TPA: hypothetical protein VKD00_07070 [Methyloceanibacter sp.]|nr:hypothetical protein [Methyloceanibacter sp.]
MSIVEYVGGPADGVQRREAPALARTIVLCYRDDTPYYSSAPTASEARASDLEGWYGPVTNGHRYYRTGPPK